MSSYKSIAALTEETLRRLSSFQWLATLLVRLFVGYFFFETGWAKLHNLDAFTTRFHSMGHPPSGLQRGSSASVERSLWPASGRVSSRYR
jgi:putative oxidoreductase